MSVSWIRYAIRVFPAETRLTVYRRCQVQRRYIMHKVSFTTQLTKPRFSTGGHPEHFDHRECFAPCEFKNDMEPRTTPHTCVSMESLRILMSGIAISWRFGLKSDVFQIFIKSMILNENIIKKLFWMSVYSFWNDFWSILWISKNWFFIFLISFHWVCFYFGTP